jgi:hypothetical protein
VHSPPDNGNQGQIPVEISQTLLTTNKKQGNLDCARNTPWIYKSVGAPKKFKTGRLPYVPTYVGLELTIHAIKSQNHLVRQSL